MFYPKPILFLFLSFAFFQIKSIASSSTEVPKEQEISSSLESEIKPEEIHSTESKLEEINAIKNELSKVSNNFTVLSESKTFFIATNPEEKRAGVIFEIPKSTEIPNLSPEDKVRLKELFTIYQVEKIGTRIGLAFTYKDENLLPEDKEQAILLLYAAYCKDEENDDVHAFEDILNEKQAKALGKKEKKPAKHNSKNSTQHVRIKQKYNVATPNVHEGLLGTTRVKTSTGYSALQDLKVGDFVECHDLKNHQITYSPITHADKVHLKSYISITLNGQELKVARNHQFYVPPLQEWTTAEALLADANLCSYLDPNIQDVQLINKELDVIRISVDSNHNFFITDNNILVHNYIPIVIEVFIAFEIGQGATITWAILAPTAMAIATGLFYWVTGKTILESPRDLSFLPLPMEGFSDYFSENNAAEVQFNGNNSSQNSKQIHYNADNNTPTSQNNPKNNLGGPGSSQDPDKDKNGKNKSYQDEIKINDKNGQDKHIFRNKEGHITDTPENRELLINVVKDSKNYLGTDKHGTNWYSKTLETGKQVWVTERNNLIRDGGINNSPKQFNINTGLCKLTP